MTILDEIAEKTRERVAEAKRTCPDPSQAAGGVPVLRRRDIPGGVSTMEPFAFEKALKAPGISFICEVKKASPSKGLIAPYFPYTEIAQDYDNAGASCISCLTEPHWFRGSSKYLTEIRRVTDIPILRKDFTVDEYMIREAKAIGADAVLLICAILDSVQLRDFRQLADSLGLSAIFEAHNADEIRMAADAGARIIGINNRNLKDFTVDIRHAGELRELVPDGTIFISESGVKGRDDIKNAEAMRADAVLVGETLMRARNKGRRLMELSRITAEKAAALKAKLDPGIKAVGVFVDEDENVVIDLLRRGIIDLAQLHGHETDDVAGRIRSATGKRVIKAVVMKDASSAEVRFPSADFMLFDAGRGSGRTFNWNYLNDRLPERPFFLAGGLSPDNVADAVRKVRPFAVDVSSGVEDGETGKSYEKMKAFIENARSVHD